MGRLTPVEKAERKLKRLQGRVHKAIKREKINHYAMTKEAGHQKRLFEWRDETLALETDALDDRTREILRHMHASIAGVFLHPAAAMKVKLTGGIKGVPDVSLPYPNGEYAGLFIEMKRPRGGYPTPDQLAFIAYLNSVGYRAIVHTNWCDAAREVVNYLGLRSGQYAPIPETWEIGELKDYERVLLGLIDGLTEQPVKPSVEKIEEIT